MAILWTIIIGFIVGVIAKFITPGRNEPKGFILTTVLGVAGAFLATYAGRYMGWYAPGETANFIGALIGAVVLCVIWAAVARKSA